MSLVHTDVEKLDNAPAPSTLKGPRHTHTHTHTLTWLSPLEYNIYTDVYYSLCVRRGEVSGPEDGVFSAVLHIRHDGGQRSAKDGHQHQESDSTQQQLADLTVTNTLALYRTGFSLFLMSIFVELCRSISTHLINLILSST